MTPAETLAAYRTNHRIEVVDGRCAVDGIRVHPIRNGFRHDAAEIIALIKAEYGGTWPSTQAGLDSIREATAEIVVEANDGYIVTVDDEWTDRESQPEFNGAFK